MRPGLILVATALAATAGAAPRAGKVVRVERRAHGLSGTPRYCLVHSGDLFGSCVGGKEPEVGDRLTAIDQNRVLGVLRITTVSPYNDGCQQTNQWMIQATLDNGDLSLARGQLLAVADVPVSTSARQLVVDRSPTGHMPGTDVIYAIDDHDDGTVDVEFVQYACDDSGNVSMTAPTSQCYEVWAAQGNRTLERLRSERFRICY